MHASDNRSASRAARRWPMVRGRSSFGRSDVHTKTTLALLGATWALVAAGAPAARASDYPVVYNWPAAIVASEVAPTPPGANDFACQPSAAHPRPVVLVPGLSGNGGRAYYSAAPPLGNNHRGVFMVDHPAP